MNTQNINNSNNESNNRVINYDIEIVRDFDGTYYVNARNELHEHIKGLPEYLPYKELKKTVKEALGVTLPPLKSLTFEGNGRKRYANAYGLQGIEIHQEPLAFGLQDKVILGSFGESRPYAIGCTVTAYKWSTKIGEFMYRLQGEDGKEYWDVARNIIHDPKGGEKATLEPASEIKEAEDIPAADLVWDEDEQGVKVWGNIDKHAENLTRMGAKRGRVVFKSNKTGLPTGADCWVLPKTKSEDVRQYVRKVHERIICDFSEAREKYGDKGHKYHEGEKVVTIYGRGTVVRGRAWHASDLIDVQLDTPTYNYIWSLVGTPQKMVAVSRNDIVSIELPEPPKEIIIEDVTLQETSEIKPKATNSIESRKRTIIARAKQDKQAWRLVKGCEVRVRKAYTNGSSDPEDWTYCVSWYADGQLVECENGVRLEQAAKALNDLPQWAEARKAA